MKRLYWVLLLLLFLSTPSCDRIRSILDLPTSAKIKEMRAAVAEQQRAAAEAAKEAAALLAQRDSLEAAAASEAETMDSTARYRLIASGFREPGNAETYAGMLEAKGLNPKIMTFNNGYRMVYIAASDTLAVLRDRMTAFKALDPEFKSIWIYDTKK